MIGVPEHVVIVGHRGDVHETLDENVGELHEETKRRDAGDDALKRLAQTSGHETRLLPLDQVALRV